MEADPGVAQPPRAPVRSKTGFDVTFGIVMPIVCLVLDPGILRGGLLGDASVSPVPLRGHAIAAYTSILPGVVLLAAWLGWKRAPLFFAGPLFFGGLVALAIGIALLPLSIPMSIALIGLLGLVPFGTAAAFFRNGARAFRAACAGRSPWIAATVALAMGAATAALPVAAQLTLNARTQAALDAAHVDDPKREAEAVAGLKPFAWAADPQRFVKASLATADTATRQRLARIWNATTGEELRTDPD